MRDLLNLIRWNLLGLFRSNTSLKAEVLALRTSPQWPVFSSSAYIRSRRVFWTPHDVEPETVILCLSQIPSADARASAATGHFFAVMNRWRREKGELMPSASIRQRGNQPFLPILS
jgi:hypothetical protein